VQPLEKFSAFYGTRRFITVFTRALHWSRKVHWWNKNENGLRAKIRQFNVVTRKRTDHWDTYKEALTSYNKEI
jgi:hypothetical protein